MATIAEPSGGGLGPALLGLRPCSPSACSQGLGAGAGAGAPAAGAASCDEDEVTCAGALCSLAGAAMFVGCCSFRFFGFFGAVAGASATADLIGLNVYCGRQIGGKRS